MVARLEDAARKHRCDATRLGDLPVVERVNGGEPSGIAQKLHRRFGGAVSLELAVDHELGADGIEHLGERRDRFSPHPKRTQLPGSQCGDGSAGEIGRGRLGGNGIVVYEEGAIARAVNVELNAVGSEFEGAAKRGERVLRLLARRSTVSDDFGSQRLNSSSGYGGFL